MDQIRLPSAQLSHRKGQEVAGPAWLQCSYRWDQAQSHGSRRGSCLRSAWPFEDALYLEALKEAKCKQMPQADPHKCSCADKSDTSICLKKTNPNSQMDHFHRKNAPLTALPSPIVHIIPPPDSIVFVDDNYNVHIYLSLYIYIICI